VLDADIDRLMGKRTAKRPVAAGRIEPARALEFGLALSAFSFVLLASAVNVVAAALALAGNLFYVLVYTRWLKRSTPQNIVIGGAAGAVPPLVGWAAATGNLSVPALLLFLIVFFWTPPHFWALAILLKQAYADADIPMLPVVRGERATIRQIVLYTVVLIAVTLLPVVWGTLGVLYATAAIVLGVVFLWLTWRLRRGELRPRAALLFHYSLAYLAFLFVAAAVDLLQLAELEPGAPLVVFDQLRTEFPRDALIKILYWIATHPSEGDTSALDQLAGACVKASAPPEPLEVRDRTSIYAVKLLGRVLGKIPGG